jgi:hypothetical protein
LVSDIKEISVMSKSGRKKKADTDVLRAGDVVPLYGDKGGSAKKKTKRKKASSSGKTSRARTTKVKAKSKESGGGSGGKIPILDLDKQILAKQRKITSVRRKGPGAKAETSAKAAQSVSGEISDVRVVSELAEQDQVIAEIVARDIRRLCED